MKAFTWINFILGLWLIVAGLMLSTAARSVMAEEIALGIIIACLAAIAIGRPTAAISWLIAIAGLWLAIGPAAISYRGMAASRANDVVVGIVVLILGIANAVYRESPVRTRA
jgi:SPW repeat-containing protein